MIVYFKNIPLNVAKISITERAQAFSCTRNHSRYITLMRYRNDVILSVLPLLPIRANLGMMLTRDYVSCHADRNTRVIFVANNVQKLMACKKSGFKSYRPLIGPIETQCSCTAAVTKSQGAHARYSSDMCGLSTTVFSQTHTIYQ